MKILITTGIFPPDIGGPATYVDKISEEFIRLGHAVKVITYSDEREGDKEKNFQIHRITRTPSLPWRYLKYFFRVFSLTNWADVIYTQDSVSAGLPTALANLFWRKRLVLKIVGDFAWEQAQNKYGIRDNLDEFQNKKYGSKIELWRKIEHWVAGQARVIITPSGYLKKIVQCWGVPENKIKVIYNAFQKPGHIDESVQIPDGDIIFTAGRLVAWKGMDTLVRIMTDLLKENPNFKLMIVGDGPEKEKLDKLIKDLGLEDKVFLCGKMPREKLLGCLKKSKIFVLNSSYEGLSHQLLEAMWLGVPVAVSRVGGNPETIEDGRSGFLFTCNDLGEIKNVFKKIISTDCSSLVDNAEKAVHDKFKFDTIINKTLRLLQ
ncbi:glycosyltransferase family 4 protein [Patescibacteria group bacterium]|nr:glycosyltransferase family 4 protein [Patescibacteria group bacterium]MBU1921719.1 glycosyltransferase family 4 protein [Patescibacteria group bacterium]